MKRNYVFFAFLTLCFAVTGLWLDYSAKNQYDLSTVAARASVCMQKLEQSNQAFASQLLRQWEAADNAAAMKLDQPEDVNGMIFTKDSLVWWSSTGIDPKAITTILTSRPAMMRTGNGWYYVSYEQRKEILAIAILRVKSKYPFQNKYLVNHFHNQLNIPDEFQVSLVPEHGVAVTGKDNSPLFYLGAAASDSSPAQQSKGSAMYLLAMLSSLFFLFTLISSFSGNEGAPYFAVAIGVFLFHLTGVTTGFPAAVHSLPFFSPVYYANSWLLNSPADLFSFALSLLLLSIGCYRMNPRLTNKYSDNTKRYILIFSIAIVYLFSFLVHFLISTLVLNSKISFDISNVFEMNSYSLAGIVVIGMLLSGLAILLAFVVATHHKFGFGNRSLVVYMAATAIVFAILNYFASALWTELANAQLAYMLVFVIVVVLLYSGNETKQSFTVKTGFLLVLTGSLYTANVISFLNISREHNERKLTAGKLENRQDDIAEYLFEDLSGKIENDPAIRKYFLMSFDDLMAEYSQNDPVARKLQQVYFNGYWNRYDTEVRCFNKSGLPINSGGDPTWSLSYFDQLIDQDGRPTQNSRFYFMGDIEGKLNYIARLKIIPNENDSAAGTIVVIFKSKALHDFTGFPELLISDKVPPRKDVTAYSFAEYRNDLLVNHSGEFNYPVTEAPFERQLNQGESEVFFESEGFSHLIIRKNNSNLTVVSIHAPNTLSLVTMFSYLFAFYSLCVGLSFLLYKVFFSNTRFVMNFKNRVQAAVVLIVFAAMVLIGGTTVYFIYKNNESDISNEIAAKLKALQITISDEGIPSQIKAGAGDELSYTLSRISVSQNTNFNIYNAAGLLLYSTQPKLYEQGINSPLMDRRALNQLTLFGKSFYDRLERTGNLKYLSAYGLMKDDLNNIIGFVNLPYYSREEDLNKAISTFFVALINIYVLLFTVSLLIAVAVANRLTLPLELIQQSISKIKLGHRNEHIQWNRNDEIGALVVEYNQMVDELAESASTLARSERESAWREMAQQVAHEIKNPLTPMKLSVQHLQKAYKENHPQLESLVQRVAQTLITQIDSLSNIASEFSNFAQMPKGKAKEINLSDVLKAATDLYLDSEGLQVNFIRPAGEIVVRSDEDQLLRVFSNLIKNAVQSFDEGKAGVIEIKVESFSQEVVVKVKDNGRGIPDAQKAKIFVPNFTTKSGGTGLGLAMAKNIIEQYHGRIWFESDESAGTTFFVALPKI